jgi:hypothetical protein
MKRYISEMEADIKLCASSFSVVRPSSPPPPGLVKGIF